MSLRSITAAIATLALAGCATVTTGTAPVQLDPALARSSHIDVVRMTSRWVRADEQFPDTFTESVHENLRACATGRRKLNLNLQVDMVRREDRITTALEGGEHELAAVAEIVDPATGAVVGRYPIHVRVDAGGPVEAIFADRQQMVSDAFGAELCRQAFGGG